MCSELTHACQNAARRATGLDSGVLLAGDARCAADCMMRTTAADGGEGLFQSRLRRKPRTTTSRGSCNRLGTQIGANYGLRVDGGLAAGVNLVAQRERGE